jgi:hypothetical protein
MHPGNPQFAWRTLWPRTFFRPQFSHRPGRERNEAGRSSLNGVGFSFKVSAEKDCGGRSTRCAGKQYADWLSNRWRTGGHAGRGSTRWRTAGGDLESSENNTSRLTTADSLDAMPAAEGQAHWGAFLPNPVVPAEPNWILPQLNPKWYPHPRSSQ